jgi:hypothetical protein
MATWKNKPKSIKPYFGFVYCIENTITGMKYIGCKTFWFKHTKYLTKKHTKAEQSLLQKLILKNIKKYDALKKALKKKYAGKKTKIKSLVESDWKTYYGSSEYLLKDIEKYGKKSFTRTILNCYKTRWETLYYEAKEQFDRDVLLDPMYYNYWIKIKLRKRK